VAASKQRQDINVEAAKFMKELVADETKKVNAKIGGLIGCKNDCYLPEQGLSLDEASDFHKWQINELASAEVDFLIAVTLPSVEEAAGIALAMEATGLPYIISFVIGSDGKVLDGTEIQAAIEYVDSKTTDNPLGYFINCSYPSFLNPKILTEELSGRLIGIQANASSLSHVELEGSKELKSESVSEWGRLMVKLNRDFGLKILGGCCGTDGKHLEYLTENVI
jgi:S-methylmethionine-dependent homocysteine/selenocysteine methylase